MNQLSRVVLWTDPLFVDRLETALRVSQRRAGFWGKLGNLLCLLPPLPRDVTVSSAQGGISAATHSSVSHHVPSAPPQIAQRAWGNPHMYILWQPGTPEGSASIPHNKLPPMGCQACRRQDQDPVPWHNCFKAVSMHCKCMPVSYAMMDACLSCEFVRTFVLWNNSTSTVLVQPKDF